jgi:two-component system, cell cycle sensor histidine kinase and response regulator CckA
VLQLVTHMLQSFGYTVFGASTSDGALSLFAAEGEQCVDLLITDVVLPGMQGTELARRMQKRAPDLRVLFISGYTDEATFHKGVRMKKSAFLLKPFTRDALGGKVREVLDGSRTA